MPTFDVAITSYKRSDYVVAAVKSCLTQGKRLRKVIVVDDASGDDTEEKLRTLGDPRVECHVRTKNGGMGMARHDVLKLCDADWAIILDSDWELMPRALDLLSDLADEAPTDTVILGGRIQWDHGGVTPPVIPLKPINYLEQVWWRNRPDGLWLDSLSAISRRAYKIVEWPPLRIGWHTNTLFFFDVAKLGLVVYSPHCLAFQKSDAPFSDSRGSRKELLERRKVDAPSGVIACNELLIRHGNAMRQYGRELLASILLNSAMYALLTNERNCAMQWLKESIQIGGLKRRHISIAAGLFFGSKLFDEIFLHRH